MGPMDAIQKTGATLSEAMRAGRGIFRSRIFIGSLSLFLLIVPIFTFFWSIGFKHSYLEVDMAVMELYTLNAAKGKQLLGPYSRFGWNHPGPAWFYMMVPIYKLSGYKSTSMYLSARIVNFLAGLGVALLCLLNIRRSDRLLAGAIMALMAVYICHLGPPKLNGPWNPYIIIIPLTLFMITAGVISSGGFRFLPLGAFLAAFLAQTHIGVVFVVCSGVAASLALLAFNFRRADQDARRSFLKWLFISSLITLVMWAPPLLEEERNFIGNIYKTLNFFLFSSPENSLMDAFESSSLHFAWLPMYFVRLIGLRPPLFEYYLIAQIITLLQFSALFMLALSSFKRSQVFRANLSALTFVMGIVGLWSLSQIRGAFFPYLTLWTTTIGFVTWALLIAKFVEYLPHGRGFWNFASRLLKSREAVAALLLMINLLAANHFITGSAHLPSDSKKVKSVSRDMINYMKAHSEEEITVMFNWGDWSYQAAIILQLYKADLDFSVESVWPKYKGTDWPLLLGENYKPDRSTAPRIVFSQDPEPEEEVLGKLLARSYNCSVYLIGSDKRPWRYDKM